MSIINNLPFNRILLVIIGLFISVLLLEIGMRFIGLGSPKQFHLSPQNAELRDIQSHWDITYMTNSQGFRDEEYSIGVKPDDVGTRIVTIGDSFTFGQGVPRGEIFPDILETKLDAEGSPVEIINISDIGIGPETYYFLLRDHALKYNPDIVILNVYANDASKITQESSLKKIIKKVSQHSHVLTFFRDLNRKTKIKKNEKKERKRLNTYREQNETKARLFLDEYKNKYGSKTTNLITGIISDPEEVARWVNVDAEGSGWAEFVFYLKKMNVLCKKNDCTLLVGIIPDGAQVDPGQLEIRKTLGVPLDDTVLTEEGKFQSLVKELANTEEILYFDPLPEFRRVRDGLYFETDLHWSSIGHQLYAEQLALYLINNNIIPR